MRYFEYQCYEGEDSADAELWHHTHQEVEVLRRLNSCDEEVGRMYQVRFKDGLEYDVFEDELMSSPEQFYRPEYRREDD